MPLSPQSPAERRPIDPQVWKACAAPKSQIPTVGDLVYYFTDSHAEQASSSPDLSPIHLTAACALCRVAAVSLLADADTDEAFARILLDPRPTNRSVPPAPPSPPDGGGAVFFAKVLTPSDANNGGGFSVPRYCADSILPPLDLAAERPVQNLTIRDAHGRPWVFRHIYRGTPRRHLLTTGWSKFVNSKKLIAGDSVVFIRNRSNELYLGVRRAYVTPMSRAFVRPDEKVGSSGRNSDGFSRGVRGGCLRR
nr:ARF20 [Lilium hybrid cultivar]